VLAFLPVAVVYDVVGKANSLSVLAILTPNAALGG